MANTYVSQLQAGNNIAAIGHSLYGSCTTYSSIAEKQVALPEFDSPEPGVHITVSFLNPCKPMTGLALKVGTADAKPIVGTCQCEANEILMFVYESQNNGQWRVVGHYAKASDANPRDVGTANAGTSTEYARADHSHNIDTDAIIAALQPTLENGMFGPSHAEENNVAVFGSSPSVLKDSGYTIETSVPPNALFTDTKYEESGSVAAATGISSGNDVVIAQVLSGRLRITNGLQLITSEVSTGIREVT